MRLGNNKNKLMLIKESHNNSSEFFITLFIKLIGFVFLFAFLDSFVQYKILIGENGCAPIASFLKEAKIQFGNTAIWKFPSLFWFSSSNNFIVTIFIIGVLSSISVVLGRFVSISLLVSLTCWLSIINAGSDFFLYIWDTFLMEAGFITFLVSIIYKHEKYFRLTHFILWFIAFRLWFSMGIVTILHNNSVPINGAFIKYFLQNQPMPSKLAFYTFHLPPYIHTLASIILIAVEVIAPFAIIYKKTRGIAFYIFTIFSVLIFLIGNYAWFNILSIIMAIPLLINTSQGERIYNRLKHIKLKTIRLNSINTLRIIVPIIYFQICLQTLLLIFLFFPIGNRYLNFLNYYDNTSTFLNWKNKNYFTSILSLPIQLGTNLKLANPYGVFKGIPIKRWEIEFEVCNDTIKGPFKKIPYSYKPGFTDGSSFFAPHHPRLEQQLFYEAQQGNFSNNYTPYQNKLSKLNWTTKYIENLLHSSYFNNNNYNKYIKVNIIELIFNSKTDYDITGTVWQKKIIFSYFINDKSVNCPLISNNDFIKYKKHSIK